MDTSLFAMSMKLFTIVSGMNAENEQRKVLGESMAYTDKDYFYEVNEFDKQVKDLYKSYIERG